MTNLLLIAKRIRNTYIFFADLNWNEGAAGSVFFRLLRNIESERIMLTAEMERNIGLT